MNGLKIGKAIKAIFHDNKNIYPSVADQGAEYPFIIYRRTSVRHSDTKDRFNYNEEITLEVIVASNSYSECLDEAERVMLRMENTRGTYNDIKIQEIKLVDASEDYIEDAYIQKLIFKIEII